MTHVLSSVCAFASLADDCTCILSAAKVHGLPLSFRQAQALARRQSESLERTGRVEFGVGILPALIECFASCTHIAPDAWVQTLSELTELFYTFKNETQDTLSDAQLLEAMFRLFDGPAQGSLLALADASPNALRRASEKDADLRFLLRDGEAEPSNDGEGAWEAHDFDAYPD